MNTENIITLAGIVITAIFSFMIFLATRESAKATKATLKLNEEIVAREEARLAEHNRIMRRLILPKVAAESKIIYDAITEVDPTEIFKKLVYAPRKLNINIDDLPKYFSSQEVDKIITAWESYEHYLDKYFKKHYGGNEIKILFEKANPVIKEFEELNKFLTHVKI